MEVQSPNSKAQSCVAEPAAAGGKSNGIVTAHRLKWHQRLAASIIYGLIKGISFTQRYRWEYHAEVLQKETGPVIFCAWHNRLALGLPMYRDYARRKRQPAHLAAVVSASKDGGIVARVLEHFDVQPVRGSSSRRGPQALLELTTWAERGYDLAITPDGPRGPRYEVQAGAIALAQVLKSHEAGYRVVLDADIKGFFDNLSHDVIMEAVAAQVADGNILKLIQKFLRAGVMQEGRVGRIDSIATTGRGWLQSLPLTH